MHMTKRTSLVKDFVNGRAVSNSYASRACNGAEEKVTSEAIEPGLVESKKLSRRWYSTPSKPNVKDPKRSTSSASHLTNKARAGADGADAWVYGEGRIDERYRDIPGTTRRTTGTGNYYGATEISAAAFFKTISRIAVVSAFLWALCLQTQKLIALLFPSQGLGNLQKLISRLLIHSPPDSW
ncbi:hypothetical protein HGRIS_014876 [Hohenbuehelia grisea]|uniref:Uncharacterized protein n=1 Tax=Hohenbuehelia grisea TaxID=104357 RepID=A0ABR3IR20_9AGAR